MDLAAANEYQGGCQVKCDLSDGPLDFVLLRDLRLCARGKGAVGIVWLASMMLKTPKI